VWHRQRHGLKQEGYLLTEHLPQARDLLTYLDTLAALPGPECRRRVRRLIDQVARLLADLHQRQLSHRDLKASNLLVSPQAWSIRHPDRTPTEELAGAGQGHQPQVWFIDLVGVTRCHRLSFRRCVRDLMRLCASFHSHPALTRGDRLRFLQVYLARGLHDRHDWKRWWRQLERATRGKIRKNQRRGRPLL
jgi:serine/threonine protein kinase